MADPFSFIDRWVCGCIGIDIGPFNPNSLATYQVAAVKRTLVRAREKSRFYREHLSEKDIADFRTMADLEKLPFTTPLDMAGPLPRFACVSQAEVDRIFTLETSGTTGVSKRIYFTREELLMTRDYFAAILSQIMDPGAVCLVFFPGNAPLSAGDLIRSAVEDAGAIAIVHGPVSNLDRAAAAVQRYGPGVIIGLPVQMLALGEFMALGKQRVPRVPHFILTGDHVSPVVAKRIQTLFNSRVMSQYGLTETGFGAAVQCPSGQGLHIRFPHLVIEIVDPETGERLPAEEPGEVVVTTLDRQAMPLVRYRTGDLSRLLDTPCACGSPFPRLDRVKSRFAQGLSLETGAILSMADLDDALFALPGVVDFTACRRGRHPQVLDMDVAALDPNLSPQAVKRAVEQIDGVKAAIDSGRICFGYIEIRAFDKFNKFNFSRGKRMIMTEESCLTEKLPGGKAQMHDFFPKNKIRGDA